MNRVWAGAAAAKHASVSEREVISSAQAGGMAGMPHDILLQHSALTWLATGHVTATICVCAMHPPAGHL
jgi:hypothetical protein